MRTLLKQVLVLSLAASALLWGINAVFAVEQVFHVTILGLTPAAIPYLARVDLSTVTPLVLMLTLIAMTRGIWRLDRWLADGKDPRQLWRPHFPFSPGLRNLLIQLGLLGTIFAFIVAFNDLAATTAAKAASYNPAVLIAPLGTALWSTFAGIAFAFLVLPPVEAWFAGAMGVKEPGPEPTREEVDAVGLALKELERRGLRSAQALAFLARKIEALDQCLGGAQKAKELIEGLHGNLSLLHVATQQLATATTGTRDALVALPEPLQEMTGQMREVGAELELERQAIRELNQSVAGNSQSLNALRSDLARLEVGVKVLVRSLEGPPEKPAVLRSFAARFQRKRAAL
jgi:hypothetical protein